MKLQFCVELTGKLTLCRPWRL